METHSRYSGLSVLNHWIAALGIVAMLTLGLAAGEADSDAAEHYIMGIHVALGFFVMLFVLWRVAWRLYEGFPPDPGADALTRYVGRTTHWALLAVIAVQLLTGPLYLFTEGEGMDVFGWFTFYLPLASLEVLHEPAEEVHKLLGEWILPILLGLHLLGGIRHYLGRRDARETG
ncbi:MAG: cytochrome b [Candidatus Wenzhouxiangella sp. M2_3B_020]